eukprot:1991572-Prymnesium_polylepis.1
MPNGPHLITGFDPVEQGDVCPAGDVRGHCDHSCIVGCRRGPKQHGLRLGGVGALTATPRVVVGRAISAGTIGQGQPIVHHRSGDDAVTKGQPLGFGVFEVAVLGRAHQHTAAPIVEVVEGVELHCDEMLRRGALHLGPRVSAVICVEHTAIVADDAGLLTSLRCVASKVAEACLGVRDTEDDDLAQIIGHTGEQGSPGRGASIRREADSPVVANGVAVERVVRGGCEAAACCLTLDAVDVVQLCRRHARLRLPFHLLLESGVVNTAHRVVDRSARVAQNRARGASGPRVRSDCETGEMLRVGYLRAELHLRLPPLGVIQVGDLEAEDGLQVGIHVVSIAGDEAPV